MGNIFDQFDAAPQINVFDQFDIDDAVIDSPIVDDAPQVVEKSISQLSDSASAIANDLNRSYKDVTEGDLSSDGKVDAKDLELASSSTNQLAGESLAASNAAKEKPESIQDKENDQLNTGAKQPHILEEENTRGFFAGVPGDEVIDPSKLDWKGSLSLGVVDGLVNEFGAGAAQLVLSMAKKLGFDRAEDMMASIERGRSSFKGFISDATSEHPIARAAGAVAGEVAAPMGAATKIMKAGKAGEKLIAFSSGKTGRHVMNATAGGTAGAIEYVDKDETRLGNTAAGAGLGLATPIVLSGASKIYKALTSKLKGVRSPAIYDDSGELIPDMKQALDRLEMGEEDLPEGIFIQVDDLVNKGLEPEQALRYAVLDSQGLTPTKGMITRNLADQQIESALSKTGEDGKIIRDLSNKNNAVLFGKMEGIGKSIHSGISDSADAGGIVKDSLKTARETARKGVTEAYTAASQTLDNSSTVDLSSLKAMLEDSQPYVDSGLAPQLSVIGKRLDKMAEGGQALDAKNAELLRREINQLMDGANPTQSRLLNQARSTLDEALDSSPNGDAYRAARKVASEVFSDFDNKPVVDQLLRDKIADEALTARIIRPIGIPAKDLRSLKETLHKHNPEAWDALRAGVLRDLLNKSKAGNAVNESGESIFSGSNLKTALGKLGKAKKEILFEPDEMAAIKQIKAAATLATIKVPGAVNNSNTAAELALRVGGGLSAIPGLNLVAGLLRQSAKGSKSLKNSKQARQALDPINALTKKKPVSANIKGAVLGSKADDIDKNKPIVQPVKYTGKELKYNRYSTEYNVLGLKAARKYAKENLAGKEFLNEATGWKIKVGMGGIRLTTAVEGKDIVHSIPVLPEMLKNAKHVSSRPDKLKRKSIKLIHRFEVPVQLKDKKFSVIIRVSEDNDGQFHYIHSLKKQIK